MNIDEINLGDPPTGAGGDTMRTAFGKTNQNFGAAKQALEDEVQTREQRLETQRDQLIALIESVNGPLPALRADFKVPSFGSKNAAGLFLPCDYSDLFTLSAPSPKWVWNAQGQLVEVPAGQPAYDHDPVTGEPLGQRIESVEATNRLPYSNDFSNWDSIADPVLTPNSGSFPAAVDNQMTLLEGIPGYISASGHSDGGVIYCHSVYAKAASGSKLRIFIASLTEAASVEFDLSTEGTEVTGGSPKDYGMIYCGDGIYRCWVSLEAPASGVNSRTFRIYGDSVLIWGAQREVGNAPSSYIPTSGSAVTRSADVMNANTSFAEQYDPEQGWLFIDYDCQSEDTIVVSAQDSGSSSNTNCIQIFRDITRVVVGSDVAFFETPLSNNGLGHHKVLFKWLEGTIIVYADGVEAGRVAGAMPNADTCSFLRRKDGTAPGNGRLFNFQMGDTISDADAIARTTL